jgi:hypothetical protein
VRSSSTRAPSATTVVVVVLATLGCIANEDCLGRPTTPCTPSCPQVALVSEPEGVECPPHRLDCAFDFGAVAAGEEARGTSTVVDEPPARAAAGARRRAAARRALARVDALLTAISSGRCARDRRPSARCRPRRS